MYYSFDDMINIMNFDPNNINVDEKLYRNILIYYLIFLFFYSYVTLNSVKLLYLIISKINEYIEEGNGNKYLTLVQIDESKDTLTIMKKYGRKSKILLDQ